MHKITYTAYVVCLIAQGVNTYRHKVSAINLQTGDGFTMEQISKKAKKKKSLEKRSEINFFWRFNQIIKIQSAYTINLC